MTAPRDIVVVMAVFEPDEDALRIQIASIAAQEGVRIHPLAVIADRVSGPLVTGIAKECGLGFELVIPDAATSSFDSFEQGLAAAAKAFPDAMHFALSDQDDYWARDKLLKSLARLEQTDASLVHCDARVVDAEGRVISPSLHKLERRVSARGVRVLLAENVVTGMTAVMTRQVVEASLPFPRQSALFFHHDLWLALVAACVGPVERLSDPLVDYRQHDRNVVGAVARRDAAPRAFTAPWRRHWGGVYYVAAYLAKSLYLRMEEHAHTSGAEVDRRRLADLSPYLSERGFGLAHLRDAVGMLLRGRADLARKNVMFTGIRFARAGIALKRVLSESYLPALAAFDRQAFSVAPGVVPTERPQAHPSPQETGPRPVPATPFADPRCNAAFRTKASKTRAPGVTIFVPSLNPSEVFAGIATAIDLGLGLNARGHSVTFVATDLPIASEQATRSFLMSRRPSARPGVGSPEVRLLCGVTADEIEISPMETLVATAWWTAHLARDILAEHGLPPEGFYYLIQDYEPGFYPWGDAYAGALESYHFGARPIFNSRTLADFFAEEGLVAARDATLVFHPAIDVKRYADLPRTSGGPRKIAFYGRPEVARNLFATGVAALDRFLAEVSPGPGDVEIVSVGLQHDDIVFGTGHPLRSLGKIPWADYPSFLAGVDLGLSLMLSPHPSHPPLEMAAAGARVVTNGFGTKSLSTLTPAIQSVAPDAQTLADALQNAWAGGRVTAAERRFDLGPLGRPFGDVIDDIALEIASASQLQRAIA